MKSVVSTLAPSGGFSTRWQIVAATCACAAGCAFLHAVDPHRSAVYPQCLFYHTTGLYCAGCGATRAAYALLHGRIGEALHDNVLFVALLPLFLAWAATRALKAWQDNAWPEVTLNQRTAARLGAAAMAVALLFTIVRNLPGAPFAWLRPV
jgi:hypothetical protein